MASSSTSELGCTYDIFLSFRGLDTRTKFTDHLYEALKREGFHVFRDDEAIEKGGNIKSELQKAIWNSRMSIIVLSKNYANSTACLFEIQTIIEHSKKESDHWILPVFYEVNPEEIKEQAKKLNFDKMQGWGAALKRFILAVFSPMDLWKFNEQAEFFDFGGKKVTVEQMEGWSAALKEVARMAGMVSGNQFNGYEARFIEDIIGILKSKRAGDYGDLGKNMLNLKKEVEYLSSQENDINSKITSAGRQPWEKQKKEVEVWLRHVQEFKEDVLMLERKIDGETNVYLRICLGKDIANKIQQVSALQEKAKGFGGLLIDEHPTGRLPFPLPIDFVESTEARNIENIWERLMSDEVMKIGVYGMGGIGKTTIMRHIHNRLVEKTSKLVYWVTVSKTSDIAKLQSDIAKELKIELQEDEEVTKRAAQLQLALSHQKSYVLILDDVWEPFQLDEVGIPEPTRSNRCKLVLTTRSFEACQKMGWEPVKVHLLTEEEAWTLFLTMAVGHGTVLAPDVQEIASQICKECACLPLAIVTVAGSLRGLREMREWRHASKELTSLMGDACDVTKVLERLQFSYNRLGDKVLRDCFLYCSLYPEGDEIEVDKLIKYWIAEGMISEEKSVEAQFDEGHAILKKLTRRCLLESFINDELGECVRMHDLIRDMALKITLSSPRFLVEAGKRLESISFEDWSEDLDRVSFMGSCIRELPDRPPFCPLLATLLLNRTELSEIADCFFTNMPSLKVLDLSHSKIKSLPESISNLEKLQAIILKKCSYLEYVPSLKRLKTLKRFSLSRSMIEELPEGIEDLVNLRRLDLVYNDRLGEIPSWKLSKLSKLQYLKILTRLGLSADHLLCLRQLRVVVAQFHNVQQFNKYVKSQEFQGLEKYTIMFGDYRAKSLSHGKQVTISANSGALGSGLDDLVLPIDLGYLSLRNFNDPKSLSAIPWVKDVRGLRRCDVERCMGLESIFSSSIFSDGQMVLSTVEELGLDTLPRFTVLFDEIPPPHTIFFKLERLLIADCGSVKNIFPFQLLQNFPNLNFLRVSWCLHLEDIIVAKEEISDCDHHQDNCDSINLPKLKTLQLVYLPSLRSIYDGVMVCPCLEEVDVEECPRLRKLPFSLHGDSEQVTALPALKAITAEDEWWTSLAWDDLVNKTILQPYFRVRPGKRFPSPLHGKPRDPAFELSPDSNVETFIIAQGLVSALCLRQLKELRGVVAQFENFHEFNDYVKSPEFKRLEKYSLCVGANLRKAFTYGKQVSLCFNSIALGSFDDLVLPADVGYLYLSDFSDVKSLLAIPCIKDARDLRQCEVSLCMRLESIFSSSTFSEDGQIVLRTVEKLRLYSLPNFRVLFDDIPPPHNIFFNLENLCIDYCNAVENIFPFQLLHNFPNLNFLRMNSCDGLKDMIVSKKEEISDSITLAKLKFLVLSFLPSLRSIYDGVMLCPCLEVVLVEECPKLGRLPFSLHMDSEQVKAPPALRAIAAGEQWWESLEWDDPLTKTILQPYLRDLKNNYTYLLVGSGI